MLVKMVVEIADPEFGKIKRELYFTKQTVLDHTRAELSLLGFVRIVDETAMPVIAHAQDALQTIQDAVYEALEATDKAA